MPEQTLAFNVTAKDTASQTFDRVGTASDRVATKVEKSNKRMGAGFSKLGRGLEKDLGFRVDKAHNGLALLSNFVGGPFGSALMIGVAASDTLSTALSIVSIDNLKAAGSWVKHKVAMLATAGAQKAVAAGMWLINAATGPMGLAVLAIAAVAIGLVIAYKKSEKFRSIVQGVFHVVSLGALAFAKVMLIGAKMIFDGLWLWVLTPLRIMLATMSHLPFGMGKPFKAAAKTLDGFKNSADKAFNGAIKKVDQWSDTLRKAPKVAKLKGDIKDLDAKIKDARKKLTDKKLTNPEKTKIRADITQLLREKRKAQIAVDALHGKTVSVKIRMANKVRLAAIAEAEGSVLTITGKPIGLAAGGSVRGRRGIDKVPAMLTHGEYVIKADRARQLGTRFLDMLNGAKSVGGDPGAVVLGYASGGSVAATRGFIRAQGGDPYVLGGAGPSVWDCSGITGAAWAKLRGFPYGHGQRYMTTQSNFAALGFRPGTGAYTIGVSPRAGHMVGNIGGLAFEAPHPGASVRLGSAATSVFSMAQRYFLASVGGAFGSMGSYGLTRRDLGHIMRALKIRMSARDSGFDTGGVAYGSGMIPKRTLRPERVLSPVQTQKFDQLVRVHGGGGGSAAAPIDEDNLARVIGKVLDRRKGDINVYMDGRLIGRAQARTVDLYARTS